ncbi:MAG TPA: hypothetical protein DCD96_06990 [Flavobacteriales bacterium]|nr:hypothetical protein [Flavobacteriales bacterium]
MKLNFCTLFDKNYLARGLVLFDSLERVCSDFNLFVLAFDDDCYSYLQSIKKENLIAVRLQDFENEA